jgi:hypothetical protein
MFYIEQIGIDNLNPVVSEAILSAVELTVMASEQRAKITKNGAATADQLLALVRLENAAARAVQRLPITRINTIAAADDVA